MKIHARAGRSIWRRNMFGDRQRRGVQLPALRRHVDPADPCARRASSRRVGRPSRQRAMRAPPLPRARATLRGPRCARPSAPARSRGGRARPTASSSAAGEALARERASRGELAGRVAGGEAQLADRRHDVGAPRRAAPATRARAVRAATSASRASSASWPAVDLLAEEQRRGVGQLVRLVEDHRVARGQELGEALVAQHHVGEEQVMVDDDDVGVERVLARLHHEAVARGARIRCRGSCRASR